MVTTEIQDDVLIVNVQGWDQLWSLKRKLRIPLANIERVYADPSVQLSWWKGFRIPGLHIPGIIVAGTYYKNGKRIFWDVHKPVNAIVIDLKDEHYDQLTVEVEDPEKVVRQIQAAIN